jgi:hypothetical protein
MSRQTEIVIGSTRRCDDPPKAIARLLEMVGADAVSTVTRTFGESHAYQRACEFFREEIDDIDEDTDFLGKNFRAEEVPPLYVEGAALLFNLHSCPVFERLDAAIIAGTDPTLRGEYSPDSLTFRVGEHDVFQTAFVEEPLLFGRYFVSITLYGHETPTAAKALFEQVVALAEFRDLRDRFKSEFGPSEVAMVLYG